MAKKTSRRKTKKKELEITVGAVIRKPGSTLKHKTGGWRTLKPVRDPKRCIQCGFCWMFCPDSCISTKFESDPDFCKGCGICAQVCPPKCIEMVKEEK